MCIKAGEGAAGEQPAGQPGSADTHVKAPGLAPLRLRVGGGCVTAVLFPDRHVQSRSGPGRGTAAAAPATDPALFPK